MQQHDFSTFQMSDDFYSRPLSSFPRILLLSWSRHIDQYDQTCSKVPHCHVFCSSVNEVFHSFWVLLQCQIQNNPERNACLILIILLLTESNNIYQKNILIRKQFLDIKLAARKKTERRKGENVGVCVRDIMRYKDYIGSIDEIEIV